MPSRFRVPLLERLITNSAGFALPSLTSSITDLVISTAAHSSPLRIISNISVIVRVSRAKESVLRTSYPRINISSRGQMTRPTYLFLAPWLKKADRAVSNSSSAPSLVKRSASLSPKRMVSLLARFHDSNSGEDSSGLLIGASASTGARTKIESVSE